MEEQLEFHVKITTQWPAVVHKCPGGAHGYRVVRFAVCRDGEEATCKHCGRTFVYCKPRLPNPADGYQWGAAEPPEGARR